MPLPAVVPISSYFEIVSSNMLRKLQKKTYLFNCGQSQPCWCHFYFLFVISLFIQCYGIDPSVTNTDYQGALQVQNLKLEELKGLSGKQLTVFIPISAHDT